MSELGEIPSSKEIRPEIRNLIDMAEKIIRGEYGKEPPEESLDPKTTFSGPIYDQNDESLTEKEKVFLKEWIDEKLGSKLEEAPIRARYRSPDGLTNVTVYNVELGDNWYLSRWQNKGEKPSFIFWPQEVYDWQLEAGYEEVKENAG